MFLIVLIFVCFSIFLRYYYFHFFEQWSMFDGFCCSTVLTFDFSV